MYCYSVAREYLSHSLILYIIIISNTINMLTMSYTFLSIFSTHDKLNLFSIYIFYNVIIMLDNV